MVDTGVDVTIISPKSYPSSWSLQEVDTEFQGIETLSQIKQNTKWPICTGPEDIEGQLRCYMADISINI